MKIFTRAVGVIIHKPASAAAFVSSCRFIFSSSVIPEIIGDENGETLRAISHDHTIYAHKWLRLFIHSDTLQFTLYLLAVRVEEFHGDFLEPLLKNMKYFSQTLQKCKIDTESNTDVLNCLAKVTSLRELEIRDWFNGEHFRIIVSSFHNLASLTVKDASCFTTFKDVADVFPSSSSKNTDDQSTSTSSSTTTTTASPLLFHSLRKLSLAHIKGIIATKVVPHFTNLRVLNLASDQINDKLNVKIISSNLPSLVDLRLDGYELHFVSTLRNLQNLRTLYFLVCKRLNMQFLCAEDAASASASAACAPSPVCDTLEELVIESPEEPKDDAPPDFHNIGRATNLRKLSISASSNIFALLLDNVGQNLGLLRHLQLNGSPNLCKFKVDIRKESMLRGVGKLSYLETLDFSGCTELGTAETIETPLGANEIRVLPSLYHYCSTSMIRRLDLRGTRLCDDDLEGIGALRHTLKELSLGINLFTGEGLKHLQDLVNLEFLNLSKVIYIEEIFHLRNLPKLRELDLSGCYKLRSAAFEVFSLFSINSFPSLQILNLKGCFNLTEAAFFHLSHNNNVVRELRELDVNAVMQGKKEFMVRHVTKFKRLQKLRGFGNWQVDDRTAREFLHELSVSLKNVGSIGWD